MDGFWEAENLNFRTFWVIFSKQILKHFLEGQKIEKNVRTHFRWRLLNENGGTRKAPSRARTHREPEEYREIPHAGPPSADAADFNRSAHSAGPDIKNKWYLGPSTFGPSG